MKRSLRFLSLHLLFMKMRRFSIVLILVFSFTFASANQLVDSIRKQYSQSIKDTLFISKLIAESKKIPSHSAKVHLLKEAVIISERYDYDKGYRTSLYHLGSAYHHSSQLQKALQTLYEGLKASEAVNDKVMSANFYNEIGGVYYNIEDYNNAFDFFNKALQIRTAMKDTTLMAGSFNNIGEIYRLKGNPKMALEFYKQAAEINEKKGEVRWLTINYQNMSSANRMLKRYDEAEKYAVKCTQLAEKQNSHILKMYAYTNMGDLYFALKKYDVAIDFYKMAYSLAKGVSLVHLRNVSEGLAKSYMGQQKYDSAATYFQQHITWKDSVMDTEKHKMFLYTESKQRTDLAKTEIENLKMSKELSDLKLIEKEEERLYYILGIIFLFIFAIVLFFRFYEKNKINKRLNLALKEREILLKEVHHRVKNNFQLIYSMLNLQSSSISDKLSKEILSSAKSRVNAMAIIHDKIYQADDLSSVKLKPYFEHIIELTEKHFNDSDVKVQLIAEETELDIESAISFGLILNELLNNCYMHAFDHTREGHITVRLEKTNKNIGLHVKDDGKGLPENLDMENLSTLGLELVYLLTVQLKGEVKHFNDNGANFLISFPLPA